MLILQHLKAFQHVSIIIQFIFRELVGSLLKSLNLNFFKNVKGQMWWRGSITFGLCVRVFCVERYVELQSNLPFTFLKNFKFSDFNKEHTSSLKMIWIMIETGWSVFKCFNINILD